MKERSDLLRMILLFSCLLAWANIGFSDENLLRNGDFEDISGNLPNWWSTNIYGQDSNNVRFYVESEGTYASNNYVTIENIKPDDAKLTQYVAVKPNTLYKLSCRIKAQGIGDSKLGANISALGILATSQDFKDTDNKWEYAELYGRTAPDQDHIVVTARLGGYGNVNTGKASFDDFKMTEVTAAPVGVNIVKLYKEEVPKTKQLEYTSLLVSLPAISFCCLLFLVLFFSAYYFISKQNVLEQTEDRWANLRFYLLVLAALILRILIAPVVEGHPSDVACFKGWADVAASRGLSNFYLKNMFVDYPPGYIYILYLIGHIRNLFSLAFDSAAFIILLKLPSILTDILSSIIIFRLARKKLPPPTATALSLLYAFNPAVIFNSAVYGQVDSVYTLFVLLTLFFIYRDKLPLASVVFVVAALTKPQALLFAPILLCSLIQKKSPKTFFTSLLSMFVTLIVIVFVFSYKQGYSWIFALYAKTLSSYSYATANAFNLFAFLGGNGVKETEPLFILSYKSWGTILILIVVSWSAILYFISKNKARPYYIGMLLVMGCYVLGTRMHERYIFPAIILVLLSYVYVQDRRFLYIFAGLSLTAFLNQSLLINLIMEKGVFWFSSDNFLIRGIALVNICLLAYSIKVGIDVFIRNRILTVKPISEIPGQKLPAVTDIEAEHINFTGKDFILMGLLTAVYSVVALVNLGSLRAPQTYWRPNNRGENFSIDLGDTQKIDRAHYWLGLGQGSYTLAFSVDGREWTEERRIQNNTTFEAVGWKLLPLGVTARYIKVTCEKPGAMLNEMALFSRDSDTPLPVKAVLETQSASDNGAENVFDEPKTVTDKLGFVSGMYFDEVYHARTAYEHLHGMEPTETTHPPLGKLIIAAGVAVFGMTPFGWRVMGTLFGIAMVPVMYLFAKRLFKRTEYAFIAAFLFTFDFMHFAQTRIATIDVFAVFFIILMYYYMYRYFTLSFSDVRLSKSFLPLLLSGTFFGLALACKWIALYGALGLAFIFLTALALRFREYRKARQMLSFTKSRKGRRRQKEEQLIVRLFPRYAVLTLLWSVLTFVLIPVAIYVLSYVPFMLLPGAGHSLSDVFNYQQNMYNYHSQLQSTHPFSSSWWQWPLMLKPVWLYTGAEYLPADRVSKIVTMGNPAVWWVGIPAVIATAVITLQKRERLMFVVLVGSLLQYVPWALAPRKLVFIYHFFATVPFMVLCITYVFKAVSRRFPAFKYFMYVYLAVVLALFVMFYPVLSGAVVGKSYVATYLRWFESWVF